MPFSQLLVKWKQYQSRIEEKVASIQISQNFYVKQEEEEWTNPISFLKLGLHVPIKLKKWCVYHISFDNLYWNAASAMNLKYLILIQLSQRSPFLGWQIMVVPLKIQLIYCI